MNSLVWALISYDNHVLMLLEEDIKTQANSEGRPCEDTGRR